MHITTVSVEYRRKFNLGNFESLDLGVSLYAKVDPDEEAEAVTELLLKQAEAIIKAQAAPVLKGVNYQAQVKHKESWASAVDVGEEFWFMSNSRLNARQKVWLKSFLSQDPYYKVRRITEGLSGDRFLLLEKTEDLPLPLIPEFNEAISGYRMHTLRVQLRIYGDVRRTSTHEFKTIYPHCHIGDKITSNVKEGQLSLSLSTVLDIPPPVNPVVVTWKPKGKARAKIGTQLSLPLVGLEAKLFSLRQQARPHLPPVSSQELLAEKVLTWNARDCKEVEVPQVILDLLLAQSATTGEWESATDLFGVIGLSSTINYVESLPIFRQHFGKTASAAAASAQVQPSVSSSSAASQQVSASEK